VRQRAVEKGVPQPGAAGAAIDQFDVPVKAGRDRQHFGQRRRRIYAVEQRERQARILAVIGGDALFAHPARLFALDRGGHQLIDDDAPRDDQRRFPAQTERMPARAAPQRIGPGKRHANAARRIGDDTMIGQMRQKRRLPPGGPAIGAQFVAQESGGGQAGVGVAGEGGGGGVGVAHPTGWNIM
jgi:hypothetical protein